VALNLDLWDLDARLWGLKEYGVVAALDDLPLEPPTREHICEVAMRDSKEARWLKKLYNHHCQICGSTPFGGELGSDISEAHHIKFLSKDGTDYRDNMMLLCPNHHTAVHLRSPTFNWATLCFEFSPGVVVALKINLHLKKARA
jgi:hypothetical protein